MVFTNRPSGLVVACEGSDEAATAAALREYDPDLRLVPQDSDAYGRRIYKVYRYQGSERPSVFVCAWLDEFGNPFDGLSVTGLLDMVKRLDRNTRSEVVDPDVKNARMIAEKRKDFEYELDEMARMYDEHMLDRKRSPLFRSKNLQAARNRVRARTKTNELKP